MRNEIKLAAVALLLAGAVSAAPQPAQSDSPFVDRNIAQLQLEQAREVANQLTSSLDTLRSEIRARTGLIEVTPEAVRQDVVRLQEQRETLQLEEAGAKGREAALTEAIKRSTDRQKERGQSDPVSEELAKVVAVREKELQRVEQMRNSHAVSDQAVETAQSNLATARAELAAARQKASGGVADADSWDHELIELSVAHGERQARLKYIDGRLGQFADVIHNVDRMELVSREMIRADEALAKAEERYELALLRVKYHPEPATQPSDEQHSRER